ncbi:MAG: site-specific DNA-methyltransferase [Gemmatimonadaceae bacterium]
MTSIPYWRKRDYNHALQIGQERTLAGYLASMGRVLREWRRVITPTGSAFLNVGDTYRRTHLVNVPAHVEAAAWAAGWRLRNRIVWSKRGGVPSAAKTRLPTRYEYVLHLAPRTRRVTYYDLTGYAEHRAEWAAEGDVWSIRVSRDLGDHPAPFPDELVERAVLLGCPAEVCPACGEPRRRLVRRGRTLDLTRPQARRAIQLAKQARLTDAHLAAIRATGISDAGKARRWQVGAGRNVPEVQRLAAEAKAALKGYFREFTFARPKTVGFTLCRCREPMRAGIVLDPFAGTMTTPRVAAALGRAAIGSDLRPDASGLALPATAAAPPRPVPAARTG